jgi:hypothetical protein
MYTQNAPQGVNRTSGACSISQNDQKSPAHHGSTWHHYQVMQAVTLIKFHVATTEIVQLQYSSEFLTGASMCPSVMRIACSVYKLQKCSDELSIQFL